MLVGAGGACDLLTFSPSQAADLNNIFERLSKQKLSQMAGGAAPATNASLAPPSRSLLSGNSPDDSDSDRASDDEQQSTTPPSAGAASSPPRAFWKRRAKHGTDSGLQKVSSTGAFAPMPLPSAGAASASTTLSAAVPISGSSSGANSGTVSPQHSFVDRVYRTDTGGIPSIGSSASATDVLNSSLGGTDDEIGIGGGSLPMSRTQSTPHSSRSTPGVPKTRAQLETERLALFQQLLSQHNVDLPALHKLSWKGVPQQVRALVWRLLVGYLPSNVDRREATLARKRNEYHEQAKLIDVADSERTPADLKMWNQISIDMPRTHPTLLLFQDPLVQQLHRRLLFLWAVRHPASGYVQGINDLATPFFVVFLAADLGTSTEELCARKSIADVDAEVRARVEADTYWCFSRLLDSIQDHYTFAQPGIQRLVLKLHDIVARVDRPLSLHLSAQDCQFIQFSFRWFNCLLMRELSLSHIVRTWDTYLSDDTVEGAGFAKFHTYVCAAFLCHWSKQLRQLDFQEIMLFLQHLPTDAWKEDEIETMLAQAFVWYSLFEGAQAHLETGGESSTANKE